LKIAALVGGSRAARANERARKVVVKASEVPPARSGSVKGDAVEVFKYAEVMQVAAGKEKRDLKRRMA